MTAAGRFVRKIAAHLALRDVGIARLTVDEPERFSRTRVASDHGFKSRSCIRIRTTLGNVGSHPSRMCE
jgi:hypothetical protein